VRSGDPSPHPVLVALVDFQSCQLVQVAELGSIVVGNAPVVGEHRRKAQRTKVLVEQRKVRHATSLSSATM
jgi:hypothetical protein